jgi:hypothetical protein
MGIKFLNKYLLEKCKSIKKKQHLSQFRGKKIVIDASIYMYKFLSDGAEALLPNMHKMVTMFHKYNIDPVFIFDGKPPPEKRELLNQRYLTKCKAKEKYEELVSTDTADEKELILLKNQFLRVSEKNVNDVRELLSAMGIAHFVSTAESDPLCVYLVNSKKVCACLTEDMDMFVYGCQRIFRNINLNTHEIDYYDIVSILKDLKMSYIQFKQILVLSGTDYDIQSCNNLFTTLSLFEKYRYISLRDKKSFYEWLLEYNPFYIKNPDKLNHCFNMFHLDYYATELKPFLHLTPHDFVCQKPNIVEVNKLLTL